MWSSADEASARRRVQQVRVALVAWLVACCSGAQHASVVSRREKIFLLASLYFAQGLPYGFFTQAMPAMMRSAGLSLGVIGAASLTALPWALKFLWAPYVDRHTGSPLGARRGWILPLQALTLLAVLLLGGVGSAVGLSDSTLLFVVMGFSVVVTNALAATQDIATDGLAVRLLETDRGLGNGIQVAAYRVGMVMGGGALVMVFSLLGFLPAFLCMAALLLIASVPIWRFREPAHANAAPADAPRLLVRFLRRPRMTAWLLLVAFYKLGDALGSPMVKPMLVDGGATLLQIGALSGTFGSIAGFLGAMLGGLCADKLGRTRTLLWCGLAHALLLGLYGVSAGTGGEPPLLWWQVLIVAEHLTGGMATVALFTVMMDASDPVTGSTDYTVQASVVVVATIVGSAASGVLAQTVGYQTHFAIAGALSVAGTAALVWVTAHQRLRAAFPPRFTAEAVVRAAEPHVPDGGTP